VRVLLGGVPYGVLVENGLLRSAAVTNTCSAFLLEVNGRSAAVDELR